MCIYAYVYVNRYVYAYVYDTCVCIYGQKTVIYKNAYIYQEGTIRTVT